MFPIRWTSRKKSAVRHSEKTRRRAMFMESLEDRSLMAVTASVAANVLTVNLSAANDAAFITNSATGIRVGNALNGTSALADTTGIISIVVNDTGRCHANSEFQR
jgi:hypothetical protein